MTPHIPSLEQIREQAMKTKYVIVDQLGRFATYNMSTGPSLTDNPNFRYQWNTRAEAEGQLPLYANALRTELSVKELQCA